MGLGTDLFLEFQVAVGEEVLSFFLEAIGCHPAIFPVNLDSKNQGRTLNTKLEVDQLLSCFFSG